MAFVVRVADRQASLKEPGLTREWVIAPGRLSDDRMTVEILRLAADAELKVSASHDELVWFQVLSGVVDVDHERTGTEFVVMISGGEACALSAEGEAELMVVRVPKAASYDGIVADGLRRRVDWSTEPVLDSEHDTRRRIYLASTGLWGTEAVKGEMIFYPPGSSGAAHHHEGAEHFQFVTAGAGTALLDGHPVSLQSGDLLYNLENEIHAFENTSDEEFVFVEFFVPGASRTVWVPGANACGWTPRPTDVRGRRAARTLDYHVHGQGQV